MGHRTLPIRHPPDDGFVKAKTASFDGIWQCHALDTECSRPQASDIDAPGGGGCGAPKKTGASHPGGDPGLPRHAGGKPVAFLVYHVSISILRSAARANNMTLLSFKPE
jgi:hypothetical protein